MADERASDPREPEDHDDELSPAEQRVQAEIRAQAAEEPYDETTAREAVELGLMEAGASEEGEAMGQHID